MESVTTKICRDCGSTTDIIQYGTEAYRCLTITQCQKNQLANSAQPCANCGDTVPAGHWHKDSHGRKVHNDFGLCRDISQQAQERGISATSYIPTDSVSSPADASDLY